MGTGTLEERVEKLERKIKAVEERLTEQVEKAAPDQRGWRWFVGIDADNPHFESAVRLGREWRFADRSKHEEDSA